MFWNKKKDANPCIKHKLWGKLKERARIEYRICPVSYSDKWAIDRLDDLGYRFRFDDKEFDTIDEAKVRLEELRQSFFYCLCNQALHMRKSKKVAKL